MRSPRFRSSVLIAMGVSVALGIASAQSPAQAPRPAQRVVEQPKRDQQVFSFAARRKEAGTEVALSNLDTQGRFTLQDEIWAPTFSVPAHFHARHSEVFYVVSGQIEWTVNGETHVMGPGDTVFIPPNTPHAVKNVGGREAHMLMLYEPGGYEEDALRESLFTAEQRRDPKIADALSTLGDFHPTTMPVRPAATVWSHMPSGKSLLWL